MAHKCPVTHLTQAAVAYALSCDIGSTVTPEARRNGPGWRRRYIYMIMVCSAQIADDYAILWLCFYVMSVHSYIHV